MAPDDPSVRERSGAAGALLDWARGLEASMKLRCVRYEVAGGVARVTLDRPAQMNAVSPELLEDLDRVCETVERDAAVKVVTLTGAGRAFCAGADLKVVQE